jgi:hypothetical protein
LRGPARLVAPILGDSWQNDILSLPSNLSLQSRGLNTLKGMQSWESLASGTDKAMVPLYFALVAERPTTSCASIGLLAVAKA